MLNGYNFVQTQQPVMTTMDGDADNDSSSSSEPTRSVSIKKSRKKLVVEDMDENDSSNDAHDNIDNDGTGKEDKQSMLNDSLRVDDSFAKSLADIYSQTDGAVQEDVKHKERPKSKSEECTDDTTKREKIKLNIDDDDVDD